MCCQQQLCPKSSGPAGTAAAVSSVAGQKGWWRTVLYLEICFIICCFNLWAFGFWGPDPGLWACPLCTVLSTLVESQWWLSPRPCTRCKQSTCCPSTLSLKFLLWVWVWSHIVRYVSQDFPSGAKQTLSTISLQYKGAVWYACHFGMCFLPTFTWTYSKLLQPIQKKITTTLRGYCLPETHKLRKANVSWPLTQEISNLRLLEDGRPYQSKDHSVPHLVFFLHQQLLCILKTGHTEERGFQPGTESLFL